MASASDLERGKFFEYKGEILQVVRKELVAYGTHSHTKLKLIVVDIYGMREKVLTFAHEDRVDMVDVKKKTATVIAKTARGIQIMDPVSYETFDAEAESSLMNGLNEGDEIIYIDYNNKAIVLEKKK